MRIINTNQFVDRYKKYLFAYYENRLGKPADELKLADLATPETLRTVLELKTYHLPPYFNLSTAIKQFISTKKFAFQASAEYHLINSINMFVYAVDLDRCTGCMSKKPKLDTLCADCISAEITETFKKWRYYKYAVEVTQLPSPAFYRALMSQFCADTDHRYAELILAEGIESSVDLKRILKASATTETFARVKLEPNFDTPKARLLAATIGCVACKNMHSPINFWTDQTDYIDGLCPACQPHHLIPANYSVVPLSGNTGIYHHCCRVCNTSKIPYALWGMCENCYTQWQESIDYFQIEKSFGLLAALLINTNYNQPTYLANIFKSRYFKPKNLLDKPNIELIPVTKARVKRYTSLQQLGIKVEDV